MQNFLYLCTEFAFLTCGMLVVWCMYSIGEETTRRSGR